MSLPRHDPYVKEHINPYAFAECSSEQFKVYLQMLNDQQNWSAILDISRSLIHELDVEYRNHQNAILSGVPLQCSISPLVGVPGFSGLKC